MTLPATHPGPLVPFRGEQQDLEALEGVLLWSGRAEQFVQDRPAPRMAQPRLRLL